MIIKIIKAIIAKIVAIFKKKEQDVIVSVDAKVQVVQAEADKVTSEVKKEI